MASVRSRPANSYVFLTGLAVDGVDDELRCVDPSRPSSAAMRDFLARCESIPWFTSISSASSTTAWTTAALQSALGDRVEVWLPLSADTEPPAALTIGQRELHCATEELAERAGFPIELYGLRGGCVCGFDAEYEPVGFPR